MDKRDGQAVDKLPEGIQDPDGLKKCTDVIAMYSHVRRQLAMFFVKECSRALELPEPEKDIDKMTKEEVQIHNAKTDAEKALIKKGFNHIKKKFEP